MNRIRLPNGRLSCAVLATTALLCARPSLAQGSASPIPQADAVSPKLRFDVTRFGAKGDGQANDLPAIQQTIDAAIRKGPGAVVVIPAGHFRLLPVDDHSRAHLTLQDAHGITIIGHGDSYLNCADPDRNIFQITRSTDITIASLKLERHPFVFTQGVIESVSGSNKTVEASIDPGYDAPDSEYIAPLTFLMVFAEPKTHTWYHNASWPPQIQKRERLPNGHWRFTLASAPESIYAGKPFVIWKNVYKGWGFGIEDAKNVRIEDVDYYAGGGQAGFVIGHSEGDIVFRRFSVTVPPGSGQLFASAGGAMVFNNRIRLLIDHCDFELTDDDNINMGTNSSHIIAQTGPRTLRIEAGRDRADYRPGDHIQVWDWITKKVRDEAQVVSVTPSGSWSGIVLDRDVHVAKTGIGPLAEQRMRDPKADIHPARRANEYDGIDRIANLDDVGRIIVRNSRFQSLRARNLLIKASDSVVEDNDFHDTTLASILVGPEFYWDEAPAVRHLVIRNNTFENISGSSIFVAAHTTESEFVHPANPSPVAHPPPESLDNQDITIEGNTFKGFGHYGEGIAGRQCVPIYIRNVNRGLVKDNKFEAPDAACPLEPRILVQASMDVVVENNSGSGTAAIQEVSKKTGGD